MSIRHHYVSMAVVSLSFAGILVGCANPQQPYGAAPQSQSYDRLAAYSGKIEEHTSELQSRLMI